MKKIYVKPSTEVEKVEAQLMNAFSMTLDSGKDGYGQFARSGGVWGEEEEDDF